jgi:hypothetical protein
MTDGPLNRPGAPVQVANIRDDNDLESCEAAIRQEERMAEP